MPDSAPIRTTRSRPADSQVDGRLAELDVIYRMTGAVSRAEHLGEVYDEAIAGLTGAIGADRVSIALFDSDGTLRFKAWRGLSKAYRRTAEQDSPLSPDMVEAEPVVFSKVATDSSLDDTRELLLREGILALAFVPLDFRNQRLGRLTVYFNSPHEFTIAEIRLVQAIAQQAAVAIARVRVELANRSKTQFIATMSHELRTPLNAIVGYTDLLEHSVGGPLTDAQGSHVRRVKACALHLRSIIEEALNFARLEAGQEKVDIEALDVGALAAEAAALLEPAIGARNLEFALRRPDQPIFVRADARRLRQVIVNLVSNALKFTERGRIEVAIEGDEDVARVVVADTGIGVRPEDLERIFEPFTQSDTSADRRATGTGLGLAVSRRYIELMGGTINAASDGVDGSTFTVRLARAHVAPATPPAARSDAYAPRNAPASR